MQIVSRKKAAFIESDGDNMVTYEVANSSEEDNEEQQLTGYEKKLHNFLSTLENSDADNLLLSIYKQGPGGQNSGMDLCEIVPIDKYSNDDLLMMIKEKYGPGDYRLRMQYKGRLRINELISIAKPLSSYHELNNSDSSGMDRVLNMIEKQNERIERLTQVTNSNPDNDRMKFMQEMMMMKEILGAQQNNSNNLMDLLKFLTVIKNDLGMDIFNQSEKEDTSFLGFLNTMQEPLTKIIGASVDNMSTEQKAKAEKFDQMQKEFSNLQTNPNARPSTMRKKSMFDQKSVYHNLFNTLVVAAKNQRNPELYADLVLDTVPENMHAILLNTKDLESVTRNLATPFVRHVQQFKPWFEKLLEEIHLALTEEPSDDNDDTEIIIDTGTEDNAELSIDADTARGDGDTQNHQPDESISEEIQDVTNDL